MKIFYEQSKCKVEPKCDMKGNEKVKGKWPPNRGRPKDVGEKENVIPYKKFNIVEKGHGNKHIMGDGRAPL